MGSLLLIKCGNSVCNAVCSIPTGKRGPTGSFNINDKAYLAMVNAGMGPTHVTTFLAGCNIPPVDESTLRKREKTLDPVLIQSAEASCCEAQKEEQEHQGDFLEGSFDAGWQKRGSGWQYNSNTGHASLVGVKTGKVIGYDTRTKVCSICNYHIGRNHTVPSHDCNIDWRGSSKGMEADMASTIISRVKEDGYEVGTLHADNDSSTYSRLQAEHRSIEKKDDKNHIKKNLSKRLYALAKKHKQLKSAGVIPYIVRCFMYAICKNQNNRDGLQSEIGKIVPHIFGDHSACSPSWCKFQKNPSEFRFQHLPNGQPLTGDKLKKDLEDIAHSYLDRVDRLVKLGSTQSNESFNNTVASKAPKNRAYGSTKSLKGRVSAAVLQKNEGYGWMTKVNENAMLSPGHVTKIHGARKDRVRKRNKLKEATIAFKRKRLQRKSKRTRKDFAETVKEGESYGEELEIGGVDNEAIPSKVQLTGKESCVVYDLETTGLSRESDITQLAAYDGEEMFNEYVKPHQTISSKASEITGLTFCFQRNQMYHHGKPVDSKDLRSALLLFIDYLSQRNLPLLVGHNIAAFDNHVLQTKLHETNLLSEFKCIVKGCVDTLKLAKAQFSKQDVGNYKQQTLVSYLLGKTYDAHDAGEDVRSLHELLSSKLEYSSKDVFPFDLQRILQSHAPMIRESALSKALANRLSNCGLSYKHLQLAYKRDPVNGIRVVLSEHGFSKQTATSITSFFENLEE